jgi:hypothetical protein
MENSDNKPLTDEQVLQIIEEANKDDIPVDIKNVDATGEDGEGKAAHAWKENKKQTRLLVQEYKRQKAELDALKNKPAENVAPVPQSNAGPGSLQTFMGQLTMQAMQNLGIDVSQANAPEAKELIRMERDRLYTEQVNTMKQVNATKERAPQMVDEALAQYSMLGDVGTEAVKRRLQKYDVLRQVDPNVIRQEVTSYFGELTLAGTSVDSSDDNSARNDQNNNRRDVAASVVAASGVKNGRPGVRPAERREEPAVKPPTAEEAKQMRAMNMTDVRLFREAKAHQHKYAGH